MTRLPIIDVDGCFSSEKSPSPLFSCAIEVEYADRKEDGDLVDALASVRTLALNRADTNSTYEAPLLLRVSGFVSRLSLTNKESRTPDSKETGELIVAPVSFKDDEWRPTKEKSYDKVVLPKLRLVAGKITAYIAPTDGLGTFLQLKPNGSSGSVLGSLPCQLSALGLRVTLTPQGIEFIAEVPIPPDEKGSKATVRLSWDLLRTHEYQLELIACDASYGESLDRMFKALRASAAPLELGLNGKLNPLPLSWPIVKTGDVLSLESMQAGHSLGTWSTWKARLKGSAVRCRMRTSVPGLRPGERLLSEIWPETVFLERLASAEFRAKAVTHASQRTEPISSWVWGGAQWVAVPDKFTPDPVFIDTAEVQRRLIRLYQEKSVLKPDSDHGTPVFCPIERGWLQLHCPRSGGEKTEAEKQNNALSGEVAILMEASPRTLRIDSAEAVAMGAQWNKNGKPSAVFFEASQPRGRYSGYLFYVETSPDSLEALPGLQSGPIATRDLPIMFGRQPSVSWKGTLEWKDRDLTLAFVEVSEAVYAWRRHQRLPLIPNMPLTNGIAASGLASVSRALLPEKLSRDESFTLVFSRASSAKAFPPLPRLLGKFELHPGTGWPAKGSNFLRLTAPTLPGIEFHPKGTDEYLASLRFDLPILDELFATASVPKTETRETPKNGNEPRHNSFTIPTAVELDLLVKQVWEPNQETLKLARTARSDATVPIAMGVTPQPVEIASLAEPYVWKSNLSVSTSANPAVITYTLDGDTLGGEEAAKGMAPRSFKAGADNFLTAARDGDIRARNMAVDLIQRDNEVQDSRGLTVARQPISEDGISFRRVASGNKTLRLATPMVPFDIKDSQNLQFWFRDLPFPDKSWNFQGKSNPFEDPSRGQDGQGFDPTQIAQSIHEWRLYVAQTNRYDLPIGNFLRFWPLRLLEVELVGGGLKVLRVLGRLDLQSISQRTATPFGVDGGYGQGNLVEWSVLQNTLSRFNSTRPVRFRLILALGKRSVPVTLEYSIPAGESGSLNGDWNLNFAFAGTRVSLSHGKIKGNEIAFQASSADTPIFSLGAVVVNLKEYTLKLTPKFNLPLNEKSEGDVLRWDGSHELRWLGITVPASHVHADLDIESGIFHLSITEATISGEVEIVPGLRMKEIPVQGSIFVLNSRGNDGALQATALYGEIWAKDESGASFEHRFWIPYAGAPLKQHAFFTGLVERTSQIKWPHMTVSGGALPLVKISPAVNSATHTFRIRFQRHEYPLQFLRRQGADRLTLRHNWNFDAVVSHKLERPSQRDMQWNSVDQLCITSSALLAKESARYQEVQGFIPARLFPKRFLGIKQLPLIKGPEPKSRRYRGTQIGARMPNSGVAVADLASSGLRDHDLWTHLLSSDQVLILGGSLNVLGNGTPLLWQYMGLCNKAATFPILQQAAADKALSWRVASADVPFNRPKLDEIPPSAIPYSTSETDLRKILYAPETSEKERRKLLYISESKTCEALVRPEWVQQVFFERAVGNPDEKALPLDPETTPFFISTLMALSSLEANNSLIWSLRINPCRPTEGLRLKVLSAPSANEADNPIQLIVLCPEAGVVESAISDKVDTLSKARLTSLARAQAVRPLGAIIRQAGKDLKLTLRELQLPLLDLHTAPEEKIEEDIVVAPSAALGWPSVEELQDTTWFQPWIGNENVLVNEAAGLSARTAATGWPAYGAKRGEKGCAAGIYYNSSAAIVFERDTSTFPGPPARHLVPVPNRVRAPISGPVRQDDSIAHDRLQQKGSISQAFEEVGIQHFDPISAPGLERAAIGLRPGAFHVFVSSVTIPGRDAAFDELHARFGRPASRGPVLVHQLRAPRGTPLPNDNDFHSRRRTFLSEADRDKYEKYDLFGYFAGSATVWRHDFKGAKWRFSLCCENPALNAVSWKGELVLQLEAARTSGTFDLAKALRLTGLYQDKDPKKDAYIGAQMKLWIGREAFSFDKLAVNPNGLNAGVTLVMNRPTAASEALAQAGGNTKISLQFILPRDQEPNEILWLPLQTAPTDRPVLTLATNTVAFGDPSYDRQLASPSQFFTAVGKQGTYALSADRQHYEREGTVFFAFGLKKDDGTFKEDGEAAVELERIAAEPQSREPFKRIDVSTKFRSGMAHSLPLRNMQFEGGGTVPWSSGDRLNIKVTIEAKDEPKKIELAVPLLIVDEAQIAPAPSVYAVVRTSADKAFADVPLYASGPVPQKVEFPNLLTDLALGHVRRRALFLWQWTEVQQGGTLALIKVDRSGGTQIVIPG